MITEDIARQLRAAGLRWQPASGDTFAIDRPDMGGERFTVSDMTIEPHHFDTGTILGFNGTTEWALDSLAVEDALWIPREDQLRELLGGTFRDLARTADGYRVTVLIGSEERFFEDEDAATAYAEALLSLIGASVS
ncbi:MULTISPECIES: hypothetical protein [unclassified Leifsonia]|jgi:hypothetical protein|uniref:hypothetical protein n=1 Tax=unclassified Leifsonia TaxID=2663824 RepID=UPI0008A77ADE|nr:MULTISPECIES: hypothetical protein [unclassified Leifsonia]SEH74003.1 hypothetical protein SAMN04515694_103120 [Leifsonia sp. CL154]SFL35604.1 hypothetical protein SAMN04515692_103121 [Leifsonia sp. CL147]